MCPANNGLLMSRLLSNFEKKTNKFSDQMVKHLLATDISRYFAQPHPKIVNCL